MLTSKEKGESISSTSMEAGSEKSKLQPDNFQRCPTLHQHFNTVGISVRNVMKTEQIESSFETFSAFALIILLLLDSVYSYNTV